MKKQPPAEGSPGVVYQVRLPVSKRTVDFVGGLIRQRRKRLGTRWRKAAPGTQAIVVLGVLRHDQRLADTAGGNSVSAATVRRWVLEVLDLLAARAPRQGTDEADRPITTPKSLAPPLTRRGQNPKIFMSLLAGAAGRAAAGRGAADADGGAACAVRQ